MFIVSLLLSAFVFANPQVPTDDWFRCTKDLHCTKIKDACGRYKAVSSAFRGPFERHVRETYKNASCWPHPDPSDPNARMRRAQELKMQEDLTPYCLANVCALH